MIFERRFSPVLDVEQPEDEVIREGLLDSTRFEKGDRVGLGIGFGSQSESFEAVLFTCCPGKIKVRGPSACS